MAREACELLMSNELIGHQFGGPGKQVEVDECSLTRRKYHKGANVSFCFNFSSVLQLSLLSSPNLSGRRLDVYHTSTHSLGSLEHPS